MRHLRTLTSLAPLLALIAAVAPLASIAGADIANAEHAAKRVAGAPLIEIAILLDTSSSMDGLIDQARTRLWSIVNDLAKTTKDGKIPDLRVALYEYGNSGLSPQSGYIRQVVPLSDDLDGISSALFALRTNGGEEYCGAVIKEAIEHLQWQPSDHYRAIFIAGNEPFTQGSVSYVDACKEAIARGVIVNTIHCGPVADGMSGKWVDGARLADGESMNIEQNRQEVAIAAPQDARIAELNTRLESLAQSENAASRKAQTTDNLSNRYVDKDLRQVEAQSCQPVAAAAYYNWGGTWIRGSLVADGRAARAPTRTVAFASPEYFQLAELLAATASQGALALDGDILLDVAGETVRVSAP